MVRPLLSLPDDLGVEPSLRAALDHRVQALPAATPPRPLDESRELVAREHGFQDWADAMLHGDERIDRRFEEAADLVVTGDLAGLRALLADHPALARARSTYGHHATLLHYLAANGVEQVRQVSPPNAVAVADALIDAGAEPDARCDSYGGTWSTTMDLLVSSCHPADRGVQADLVEALCRRGAKVDGPDDDGGPLWVAITWGYTASAERLVRCGARVDNVMFAAVVGTLLDVAAYFDADGRISPPRARSAARVGVHGAVVDARHLLEYALIYAALHGRRDIVAWLLAKSPDLTVKEPVHGATALGAAKLAHPSSGRPRGCPEIVALLEQHVR